MEVVDAYCGVGGFSCGAITEGCSVVLGVDREDSILRLWDANTMGRAILSTLWRDYVDWPETRSNLHTHFSPPCTHLSKAKAGMATTAMVEDALDSLRRALDFVLSRQSTSWSLENVSSPQTRGLLQKYVNAHPQRVAFATLDAVDYACATNRPRLIAGPPTLIRRLREMPVRRISVKEAFDAAGLELPAQFIRNGTRNREGRACVRSVQGPAHTVTASHPLTWCEANGRTVRCLTVKETAVLQGFPSQWLLPKGSRAGIRALGNAVCPPLAAAIMRAACACNRVVSDE